MTEKWSMDKAFKFLTHGVEDLPTKGYLATAVALHMMRLVVEDREAVDVFVLTRFEEITRGAGDGQ